MMISMTTKRQTASVSKLKGILVVPQKVVSLEAMETAIATGSGREMASKDAIKTVDKKLKNKT